MFNKEIKRVEAARAPVNQNTYKDEKHIFWKDTQLKCHCPPDAPVKAAWEL